MLKKILVIVGILLVLLFLWFVFQSVRSTVSTGQGLGSFLSGDSFFSLSNNLVQNLSFKTNTRPAQVSLEELGEFSPVAGLVEITKDSRTISTQDVQTEYIEIRALETNAQPINISNWSLQSMVSDEWISLPQGAPLYALGEVNEIQDVYLTPGESAVIATRQSPVGISFRVNRCSGFLNDTQTFEPKIKTACMKPTDILPPTAENIKKYGSSCISFVEQQKKCSYTTSESRGVDELTQECRDFIQPRLTYSHCIDIHAGDADFYDKQEWRLFLNQDYALWRENYEIIRLLDEKHRTVDVITY